MKTFLRLCLFLCIVTLAQAAGEKAFYFDKDKSGSAPSGLDGGGEVWRVVAAHQAFSQPNVLMAPRSALSGGYASLLLVKDGVFQNGDLGFRFRVLQEGKPALIGLVWRFIDPDNFYSVQLDVGSESVSLIRRVKGKTKVLGTESLVLTSPVWHALQVRASGRNIAVVYDDGVVLQAMDKLLDKPGRLGLQASPGDAVHLDDFAYRSQGEWAASQAEK